MRTLKTLLILAAVLLIVGLTGDAVAQKVSPTTDPVTGYPLWYQDATVPGIRVQGCLDPKDPFCVLLPAPGFNTADPVVFPTNFPVEFFYFVADANPITTPGCPASGFAPGRAKWRGAVEGSFLTGTQTPGQQSTFSRTKIVADGLCPNTAYIFTHPYGADTLIADKDGQVVANKKGGTIDVGCGAAPCDFTVAMTSRVFGGFLQFDPTDHVPPAGYLGDAGPVAGTLSKIVGSPQNTNFFSISDAFGTVLASTDQFTVSGKIAGPLLSSPQAVDFGGQAQGTQSTPKTIIITNVNATNITVSNLSFTGADAADFTIFSDTCTGTPIAEDQTCVIGITFTPSTLNLERAALNITHDGPFGSPMLVNLTGTGIVAGNQPAVSLAPTSLTFAAQRVHTTSTGQTVTVTNTGTAPLGATVSITGTDASQFVVFADSCTGNFVAAGSSCAVTIQLAPKVAGNFSASLNFTDNAADSPQSVALSGSGTGGLASVSATFDQYKFPDWYQDENAVQVVPCLTSINCVLLADANFNPSLPLSFLGGGSVNFPSEFFYFVADSDKITTPGCPAFGIGPGTANFRGAMEGSFFLTTPIDGDQIAFARTRIVVKGGLCPGHTYAFTHPYGTDLVTADAAGGVVANKKGATIDIGCLGVPCDFSLPLSSRVFTGFLKWDPAVPPSAPAGFLGDAVTLHTVVGSNYIPAGGTGPANFFQIVDPDTNQVIGRTDLFTVSAQLAGPISAAPSPLIFGPQNIGTTSATQTVTLTNNDPVNSVGITSSSFVGANAGDYSVPAGSDLCSGVVLAPAATCTIGVAYSPLAIGQSFSALSVVHAGLNSPVQVPVSGTGLAANLPPVAVDDTALDSSGAPVTINVLANDTDPDGNLPLTVAALTQPANGSAVIQGVAIVYTSNAGFTGTDTFTYQAADSLGALSNTATVTVTVQAPFNQPPIAANDVGSTQAGAPVAIDVLLNDIDPDGNIPLTVVNLTQPANGSVQSGNPVVYTPNANFAGTDTFTYQAQDSLGALSNVATVTVTVNANATTTSVTAAPVTYPANATATVTVSSLAGAPTGNVGLTVDGIPQAPQALVGGVATFTITSPAAGNHVLVANYAAQGGFASSSNSTNLAVSAASTTTTITAPTANFPNASVTVTVNSLGGTPLGSASLSVDGGAAISQALVNGSATFALPTLGAGTHTLSASYAAQGNFGGSSNTGSIVVNRAPTTTTIAAPNVTFPANASVTVTVSAAGAVPTGNVSLSVDGGGAATLALTNGKATFTINSPNVGTHTLSSTYLTQGNFAASSGTGTLTVNPPLETVTATATATVARGGKTAAWVINGTTNQVKSNTITVKLARTGAVIGTAVPSGKGVWKISLKTSPVVPVQGDQIAVTTTFTSSPFFFPITVK